MILCQKCGTRTGVYDSRISFEGNTRRKRLCPKCSHRFATIEILDTGRPLKTQPTDPEIPKAKVPRPAKKGAPKRIKQEKAKRFDDEDGSYEDAISDDFYEVARDLGIGGLNEYD